MAFLRITHQNWWIMQIQSELSNQTILEELGRRIARTRLNQNLKQDQLAKEAGVGVNTIYRIEQGHSTQLSNLIGVLRALGLTGNFDVLIPELPPSPIAQAKQKKEQRKRASQPTDEKSTFGWRWND